MKIPVITAALLTAEKRKTQAKYSSAEIKGARQTEVTDTRAALNMPIIAALAAVNGRASSFSITTGREVRNLAHEAEDTLDNAKIPQAERVGTSVTFTPAGPSANAYKYAAVGTKITLQRGVKGAWYLTDVERCEVYPRQPKRRSVTISQAARDAVIRHALEPFAVRAAATSPAGTFIAA